MEQKIIYECMHCGKKNPEYLAHKGGNCCEECLKDLNHYVVYDDEEGFINKLTILLTKKSAQSWINFDDAYKKKIYRNLRIVSVGEYGHLKLIKDIHYYKKKILETSQQLAGLNTELKIKECILNGGQK